MSIYVDGIPSTSPQSLKSDLLRLTYELISTIKSLSMRPKHTTLTPQELEIMKVIWKLETATVRQVYEKLLEHRRIGREQHYAHEFHCVTVFLNL